MKHKNKLKRLNGRIEAWEKSSVVRAANQKNPGSFKKPGSLNK
jgi:hypothetical protein